MSLLEDRILRIIELRQKGYDDSQIAEELGVSENMVPLYERTTRKIIQDSINSGHQKLEDIAMNIGLPMVTLDLFANYYGIEISEELSETRQKTLNKIKQAIEGGAEYAEDIAEKLGLRPATLDKYRTDLKRLRVRLPPYKKKREYLNIRRIPSRDKLLAQGLTLKEIAEQERVSGERIRQYATATGQDELRKQAKLKRKQKEELRKQVLGNVSSQILLIAREKLTEDEKWAYDKAEEYFSKKYTHYNQNNFFRLFKLFKIKKQAETRGIKLSLTEYQKLTGITFPQVGKIFEKIGLEPDYGKREKHIIPLHKKQALERAVAVAIPMPDISYFLGLPFHGASIYYMRKTDLSNRPKVECIKNYFRGKNLTYRLASQIYEAEDPEPEGCGFTHQETCELLDINQRLIDYALEHRIEIESEIISALKILYLDREITKPYGNSERE